MMAMTNAVIGITSGLSFCFVISLLEILKFFIITIAEPSNNYHDKISGGVVGLVGFQSQSTPLLLVSVHSGIISTFLLLFL